MISNIHENPPPQWLVVITIVLSVCLCGMLADPLFTLGQLAQHPAAFERLATQFRYKLENSYTKATCGLKGGELIYSEFTGEPYCIVVSFPTDVGKVCTDSSQCQGKCGFDPNFQPPPTTLTPIPPPNVTVGLQEIMCSQDAECIQTLPSGHYVGHCSANPYVTINK